MGCCFSLEANAAETRLPIPEWGKPFKCRLKKKGMLDADYAVYNEYGVPWMLIDAVGAPWDDGYVDFERAMDAGSDSDLEPDERWWRRRLVSEEGRGKGDERSTRKAWREIPDCPPELHRISSPAVVTLELG